MLFVVGILCCSDALRSLRFVDWSKQMKSRADQSKRQLVKH